MYILEGFLGSFCVWRERFVCLFVLINSLGIAFFQEFLPELKMEPCLFLLPALLHTVSVAGMISLNKANSEVVSRGSGEHLVCVCTESFSSSPESSRATRHGILLGKNHCYSKIKKKTDLDFQTGLIIVRWLFVRTGF